MNFKKYIFEKKVQFFLKKSEALKSLKRIENLSEAELVDLNFEKRKDLVSYAYYNIPFYKKFYRQHNFHPENLVTEDDWSKIPTITRQILKENTKDIKNPEFPDSRLRSSTTGGSTGTPLQVYFDKEVPLELFGWRTLDWWGVKPWENQAFIYRNIKRGLMKLINTLMWWPTKRILLDCSSMSDSDMEVFAKKINSIKPAFIQGYVGGIYDFAKYVKRNNLTLFKPKAIWVTAAPLSESTRKFIEDSLGAPVFDQYGCSEVFWLAAECSKKTGLHVLSDLRHLEFLDDNNNIVQKGDHGYVTITDLENKAFPIIRYKNGDNGGYLNSTCNCGLPFPLIDKIKGRVTDNIVTRSGLTINGAYLTTIFDNNPDLVDSFQIIQRKNYSVVINCVISKGKKADDNGFAKILGELRKKTNNELEINYNFVDAIIQDRGKLRFVISEL